MQIGKCSEMNYLDDLRARDHPVEKDERSKVTLEG